MDNEEPRNITVEVGEVVEKMIAAVATLERRVEKLEGLVCMQQTALALLGAVAVGHQEILSATSEEKLPSPQPPTSSVN